MGKTVLWLRQDLPPLGAPAPDADRLSVALAAFRCNDRHTLSKSQVGAGGSRAATPAAAGERGLHQQLRQTKPAMGQGWGAQP